MVVSRWMRVSSVWRAMGRSQDFDDRIVLPCKRLLLFMLRVASSVHFESF